MVASCYANGRFAAVISGASPAGVGRKLSRAHTIAVLAQMTCADLFC